MMEREITNIKAMSDQMKINMDDMGEENVQGVTSNSAARRKAEKTGKNDPRSWENIIKSITDMTEAQKLEYIQEKYMSMYNDFHKMNSNYHELEKSCYALQKEFTQVRSELNKNTLNKAKLESLCHELQKQDMEILPSTSKDGDGQNKAIKNENITRVKEEEKRHVVASDFTERLNALSSMMDKNKGKSVRLGEGNINMTIKLMECESHLADVYDQLDAQKELFESKLKKMELEHRASRLAWEEERKALLESNRILEENIRTMQTNLDVYKNQCSDSKQTMIRSNEVIKSLNAEISKLQKANTTLEKERNDYAARLQSICSTILDISEQKQQLLEIMEMHKEKEEILEKHRTKRTALFKQLEDEVSQAATILSMAFSKRRDLPDDYFNAEWALDHINYEVELHQLLANVATKTESVELVHTDSFNTIGNTSAPQQSSSVITPLKSESGSPSGDNLHTEKSSNGQAKVKEVIRIPVVELENIDAICPVDGGVIDVPFLEGHANDVKVSEAEPASSATGPELSDQWFHPSLPISRLPLT